MDDFDPILNAVKNFAPPYGGLAIGIISLAFVVARNKDTVENILASTISEIRNRLPGIDLYRRIYDEDHPLDHSIQAQIVTAYQNFIDFCIAATEYYKSGRVRRWLGAFGRPQSLLDSSARVQGSFVDVERTSHELLAKSVDGIRNENKDLKREITELRNQLTNGDKDAFEQTFNLGVFSEELQQEELADYTQNLAWESDINLPFLHRLQGPHLDNFVSRGAYRQWETSASSCLLILSGSNYQGLLSPHCWLSWAAVSTIERQRASSAYCAYYILPQKGATFYQVLPNILLQLIAKKKNILRMDEQRDGLRTELHEFPRMEMSGNLNKYGNDSRADVLSKIAKRVMRFFSENDTVYIIVDRADLCTDDVNYDHRKLLVDGLVQMVNSALCRVKILIVINRSIWNVEEHQYELGIPVPDQVIVHTMNQSLLVTGQW